MSASEHENGEVLLLNAGDDNTAGSGPLEGTPPLFLEVQRFKQWIFWVPVLAIVAVVWWQFVQQVVLGHPQGEEPVPNWLAWTFTILFGVGLPIFVWKVRLITEVRPGEVTVRLVPFRTMAIPTGQISKGAVRQYSAFREYGGWGVKTSRLNGRAYCAYGDQGVQLLVADKDLILIGSQRSQELLAAIQMAGADLDRPDAAPEETSQEFDEDEVETDDEGFDEWDDDEFEEDELNDDEAEDGP